MSKNELELIKKYYPVLKRFVYKNGVDLFDEDEMHWSTQYKALCLIEDLIKQAEDSSDE